MKRFNVVIPKEDGGVEVYPMKEWLRQHPEHIPTGCDGTSSTSHELRNGLKKSGWTIQATDTEIRLIMPGDARLETTIEEVLGDEDSDEGALSEASFALEYQLRDFLAQNLSSILVEGRRVRLFVDPTGRDGIEFPTAVGPIDILALDDAGDFVVFELKRARSPDHAIGQLTRYMGWVKQTIGKDLKVRGVIVAKMISENLRYAISVIPEVSLFEYEVSFQLKAVPRL
ncbi:MAG TPA: endonuclease NucS domain-containing protein [Terracidiphilus sp.]|jgi:hypothetical protein